MANNDDKIIGANLRKLRNLKNMSQAVLAEKLKITFQQIQKYEKGINRISLATSIRTAKALKISIFELTEDLYSEAGIELMPLKDRLFLKEFNSLSEETKDFIKTLMLKSKN